jgi:hypothetical protein
VRCYKCQGSKQIMGGGMIYRECDCVSQEYISNVPIDKRSKEYKESINKIMKLYDCTRQEAADLFEEEYNKI